ncbi:MAG TPA: immunoglobulin domain-containing protein, partial [Candidatus Saccharimonadales bacterium]|nr:immunoglobulin domain-containing protein [Candidatus Saccharimonadales bacterium]
MIGTIKIVIRGLLAVVITVAITGCKTCCIKNAIACSDDKKAGVALIACQPVDIAVPRGHDAVFHVTAYGKDLRFQWFRVRGDGPEIVVGATDNTLTITGAQMSDMGLYWCEIESSTKKGAPVPNSTRFAAMSVTSTNKLPTLESQPFRATAVLTNICGTNCGYSTFNNGGLAYTATTTVPIAQLIVGGVPMDKTWYDLQWRVNS